MEKVDALFMEIQDEFSGGMRDDQLKWTTFVRKVRQKKRRAQTETGGVRDPLAPVPPVPEEDPD